MKYTITQARMSPLTMTTEALLQLIADQQSIQERNPPLSLVWLDASATLAPLFAEMARRQTAGELT
jgi:hypothetical protein